MTPRSEHTSEKVADLIAEAREHWKVRNLTGQTARLLDRLADALEVTVKEMHARELHHLEEEQARAKAEAERDEALAAIREALAFESILPAIASEPRRILSRITDKEQQHDQS